MTSRVYLNVIHALRLGFSLHWSHFIAAERQLVMPGRIEIIKLIDSVQNIGN